MVPAMPPPVNVFESTKQCNKRTYALIYTNPMYIVDDQMTIGDMEALKADIDAQHMDELEEAYLMYHVQALNLGRQ